MMDAMINNQLTVSFPGWLPTGQKTYLSIPVGAFTPEEAYDYLLNYSQRLLAKGWLLTEPGLEAGEQAYSITHIVRSTQPSKDGIKPPAPIIYFYHDSLKWADLKTWLNTPEDIAEFERWSGVKLASMKAFPSGARLELGRNPAEDTEFVTALSPARRVIWKHNPDYVDGSKTESKRLFERFDILPPPPAPTQTNASASVTQDVSTTEPSKTANNAQNGHSDKNSGNPETVDETDKWFTELEPTWNTIKSKLLKDVFPQFWSIVAAAKIYDNGNHMRNSVNKLQADGLIVPASQTLRQAVMVIVSHKQVKYGDNTTKLSTDDLKDSMERAKEHIA